MLESGKVSDTVVMALLDLSLVYLYFMFDQKMAVSRFEPKTSSLGPATLSLWLTPPHQRPARSAFSFDFESLGAKRTDQDLNPAPSATGTRSGAGWWWVWVGGGSDVWSSKRLPSCLKASMVPQTLPSSSGKSRLHIPETLRKHLHFCDFQHQLGTRTLNPQLFERN